MVKQERWQDSDMGSRPRLRSREGWPKNGRRDGDGEGLAQALGMREIASGVGILTQSRPTGWVWVAGDAMDLALLGAAMTSDRTQHDRVVAATAAVVGVTALDLLCGQQLSRHSGGTNFPRGFGAQPVGESSS
jgi:hypothetical protein